MRSEEEIREIISELEEAAKVAREEGDESEEVTMINQIETLKWILEED